MVFQGNNATVTLTPFGSPPFTYAWLSNDVVIASGSANSFTFTNTTLSALTNYQVIIINNYGNFALNLPSLNSTIPSPLLISQPADQTLLIGSAASFSGPAAGVKPLSYQWYFNSSLLAGATNVGLTVSPASINTVGNYKLVVTNSYGSITSRLAALTVLLQPNSYGVSNSGGGNRTVFVAGLPGSTNRLWTTTNLLFPMPQWQVLATNVMDGSGLGQFLDTNTAGVPAKFYRLSIP